MHLQPTAASPYPVGARIARPFVPDVITTTLRGDARRVIWATAKPLYPIDGKAAGLDRRNPRPPSLREGDRPVGGGRSNRRRWKAFVPIAFMPNILLFSDARQAYEAYEAQEAYEAYEAYEE